MLEKCAVCNARILAGAVDFLGWQVCSEGCCAHLKGQLVEQLVPAETIAEQVQMVFDSPCPQCGKVSGNGLYSATKLTGMLVFYQIQSGAVLCCASCGRKNRMTAALHCLFLGWWSVRSAIFNLFVLPSNLIACLFIRQPAAPSPELTQLVLSDMADSMHGEIADRMANANQVDEINRF